MNHRSNAGGVFGAGAVMRPNFGSGARVRGRWSMVNRRACRVSDPHKAAALLWRVGLHAPRDLRSGVLRSGDVERYMNMASRRDRREMEPLLSGGDRAWAEEWSNIVVNAGLDHLLDVGLAGGAQIGAWYLGLISGAAPVIAAADTLAAHAGWAEFTNYTGNRLVWTDGGVAAQSVDNSASPAEFPITAGGTIGGAFLASANAGTAGTLYAAGTFAASRDVLASDTLSLTATFTQAAA